MTLQETAPVDLPTPSGPMRTHLFRPTAPGRYPGILLYSEIFQVTAPIRRTAALLAGHGFIVAVPEIYHEYEPAGTILAYDQAGADRGNALKTTKPLAAYDCDLHAVTEEKAEIPKLLRAYMSIGAKICGPPALDRHFQTIDFLTFVDLETLSPATRARFFS